MRMLPVPSNDFAHMSHDRSRMKHTQFKVTRLYLKETYEEKETEKYLSKLLGGFR